MAVLPTQVPPPAQAPNPTPGAGPSQPPQMPGIPGLGAVAGRAPVPGGGMQDAQMQLMLLGILVGMGLPEYARTMDKLHPKNKSAAGKEAAGVPQQTSPQVAAQLAQLAQLKQRQAMAGGMPGAPGAAPAMPNPMAMFGR